MSCPQNNPSRPVLAVCGVEEHLHIALGGPHKGEFKLLHEEKSLCSGRMIETLAPAVDSVLKRAGLKPSDLGRVACVRGPGSFTGIRITLAWAEAFSRAASLEHKVELAGLDYLSLVAASASGFFPGPIWVMTYARRGIVYLRGFEEGGVAKAALRVLTAQQAVEQVIRAGGGTVAGSGLRKNPDALDRLLDHPSTTMVPPDADLPSGKALLTRAMAAEATSSPIPPLYVRATDAEDNLDSIAESRGLDPKDSRVLLGRLTSRKPS